MVDGTVRVHNTVFSNFTVQIDGHTPHYNRANTNLYGVSNTRLWVYRCRETKVWQEIDYSFSNLLTRVIITYANDAMVEIQLLRQRLEVD